ncbi:MAG: DegT/DnrJ/EryC1/StrS family aminotransferase, partial [Planctomycetota bacterium]
PYYHEWVGGNFRMDSIQAAALLVKLRHLDEWSARRRANASRYDELLKDCDQITTPVIRDYNVSIYNHYIIRAQRRDELQGYLNEKGIVTVIYYPLSMHQQPCLKYLGYKEGDFPHSEAAAREVLSIPICPELTDEQIEYVAEQIKNFYS